MAPRCRARLLPPSLSTVGSGGHAPSLEVLSHDALVTLPTVVVEALWKEREDALGAIEDAWRKVKEERLVVAMAENVHDMGQVEVARLREELKGMGCSLPFSLPTESSLGATRAVFGLDAPCL